MRFWFTFIVGIHCYRLERWIGRVFDDITSDLIALQSIALVIWFDSIEFVFRGGRTGDCERVSDWIFVVVALSDERAGDAITQLHGCVRAHRRRVAVDGASSAHRPTQVIGRSKPIRLTALVDVEVISDRKWDHLFNISVINAINLIELRNWVV